MPAREHDDSDALVDAVRLAARRREPVRIVGGDSKRFLGRRTPYAQELSTREHCGVVNYQPEELVLTARAGTPLTAINAQLDSHGQHLPFDPPQFGPDTTFGGAIASGLSGPARPFVGPARDFVLGVRIINGRGQVLRFGGEVMKNVAGYDLSRLLTGAFGTLGVLLDVSVKVLPAPRHTSTLCAYMRARQAIDCLIDLRAQALPITGAMWHDGELSVRLAGSEQAVEDARASLSKSIPALSDASTNDRWPALRDLTARAFRRTPEEGLYRLSVAPASPPVDLPGTCVIDWAGAQRWLVSSAPIGMIRNEAATLGGHVTRYHAPMVAQEQAPSPETVEDAFHPLPPALYALHRRLKAAFDPHGVLNAGRLYPGI
ncbi:MAG: glycolate oxidase subunit GlcE [Pseudomonadota bacterium]